MSRTRNRIFDSELQPAFPGSRCIGHQGSAFPWIRLKEEEKENETSLL